uniref:Uncharacterized protein n=1 Tax=Rousettus aegyptiacus TaxID=9407 RepID=A0A7J8KAM3_ROUAE|nr:hypothetical protein HJG63_007801 [Rousettus aegyptiacus]
MYEFLCKHVFDSLRYIPRRGIAGPFDNPVFTFLHNYQTVFHSGCTILHSSHQYVKVPVSPHPHQHFIFLKKKFFFNYSHLSGYEFNSFPICLKNTRQQALAAAAFTLEITCRLQSLPPKVCHKISCFYYYFCIVLVYQ